MDPLMIVLRIFHISFGVFWVGQLLYRALTGPFMMPRLRASGLPMIGPGKMVAQVYIMNWWTGVSAIITVGTGVAITLILRWGNLGSLFTTPWGWAMLYGGFVATVAFLIVAWGITGPAVTRQARLIDSIQGRPPTPEEAQQMGKHSATLRWSGWWEFWLHVITVVAMATARFL